jgi:PEP-CTERM motif-containing protein
MKTRKFLHALGMFATVLTASAISTSVLAAQIVTCPDSGATQTQNDLTVAGTTATINDAIYTSVDTNGSVGTGVFPAMVRIQGNDCIEGYNTQGTEEFDTVNNSSVAVLLSTMYVTNIGGIDYVEFHLDINQNKNNDAPSGPSLDNVQLFVSSQDDLSGWTNCLLQGTLACVYNMDAGTNQTILLDYVLNKGSGSGYDMQLLVPVSVFGSALADPTHSYVYLYSSFGAVGGNYAENDGFEEWQYRVCPAGTVCVREPPPPDTNVPEPASVALVGLGLLAMLHRRSRRVH